MRIFKQLTLVLTLLLTSIAVTGEENADLETFSEAELEQILAPIALYPDTVLTHILIASTYPIEVVQAERWTAQNPDVTPSDAVEAVSEENWDPSVKALVAFPQILKRLSDNLEWTQKLGDAFLQDEAQLLASVQSLRKRALEAGSLDEMEKVSVVQEEDTIVIEPIEREVVYVPYYDTRVVYGPWHWSHYPPVHWQYPHHYGHFSGHHHNSFYWGPRIHVSFGFFFNSFHWHNRHIVRIPYHHYRPHHYYNRHQIVRHREARRWAHNPTHRRGVSYRSVSVSNRYRNENSRPSRSEVNYHRKNNRSRDLKSSNTRTRNKNQLNRSNRDFSVDKRDTRIASPDRIKKELRDGKISVKERKNRPTYSNDSKNKSTKTRNNRSSDVRQPTNYKTKTRVQTKNRTRDSVDKGVNPSVYKQTKRQPNMNQHNNQQQNRPVKVNKSQSAPKYQSRPPKNESSGSSSNSRSKSNNSSKHSSRSSSKNRSSGRSKGKRDNKR